MWKLCPLLKFLATPLPSLVVDEENLVIGFGPPTLEMLLPSLLADTALYCICIKSQISMQNFVNSEAWDLQLGRSLRIDFLGLLVYATRANSISADI